MRDKYFYSIYTAFNFNGVMSDPELWVERKSLKEASELVGLSPGQIRYLFNGKNQTPWFGEHGAITMIKKSNCT